MVGIGQQKTFVLCSKLLHLCEQNSCYYSIEMTCIELILFQHFIIVIKNKPDYLHSNNLDSKSSFSQLFLQLNLQCNSDGSPIYD